jgi:hypothetical protein
MWAKCAKFSIVAGRRHAKSGEGQQGHENMMDTGFGGVSFSVAFGCFWLVCVMVVGVAYDIHSLSR